jgi:hypothetical protein
VLSRCDDIGYFDKIGRNFYGLQLQWTAVYSMHTLFTRQAWQIALPPKNLENHQEAPFQRLFPRNFDISLLLRDISTSALTYCYLVAVTEQVASTLQAWVYFH